MDQRQAVDRGDVRTALETLEDDLRIVVAVERDALALADQSPMQGEECGSCGRG
jgi:hypothetical protein